MGGGEINHETGDAASASARALHHNSSNMSHTSHITEKTYSGASEWHTLAAENATQDSHSLSAKLFYQISYREFPATW